MADLPYRIVIGLEVHVQLLTRTKLFCGCSTAFGQEPNSATCPVCLGLPGVLPVLNRRAFDLALRAALALECDIAPYTKWDRKNYFYPDLPKNFQTSQYDLPLGKAGALEITTPTGVRRIGIIRAHLEEDAGKMLHDEVGQGRDSLVDLNRTGTPLLEIVSQPELASPEEARIYLEEMRLLMRELGVSDCEMQEGSLRCDANVNIHIPQPEGSYLATPIVEIKNLNSFRFLERSTRYEAARQYAEWQSNPDYLLGKVGKMTAGWDEARGVTVFQRTKEAEADYRYFPEPDLVPVVVDEAWLNRIRSEMGELPRAMGNRLVKEYGLSSYDVGVLTGMGRQAVAYFEAASRVCGDPKATVNWITNQLQAILQDMGRTLDDPGVSGAALGGLIAKQKELGLGKQTVQEVFVKMLSEGIDASKAIADLGFQAADEGAIRAAVLQAIAGNARAVADYKKGKVAAANAIKGAVLKQMRGAARPDVVEKLLREELDRP